MLADFYIPWLSNAMKIAVQKNHFFTEVWTLLKKRRLAINICKKYPRLRNRRDFRKKKLGGSPKIQEALFFTTFYRLSKY